MWDLKEGDTVYLLVTGNALRRLSDSSDRIKQVKVKKVGRKYLTIDYHRDMQFIIDDARENLMQRTNYSVDYYLYRTREEIELELEHSHLEQKVRKFFRDYYFEPLNLEFLRKVNDLITEYKY